MVAAYAAAGTAAASVAVAAAAAAAAAVVSPLWQPVSPLARGSVVTPDGARRGHAVTTLVPSPALGSAHLLRFLFLQLLSRGPC